MASGQKLEIDYTKVYHSNRCGDFMITEELQPRQSGVKLKRMVRIRFLLTGTFRNVELLSALKGAAVDPYYPNILGGIACLGEYKQYEYACKKIYDIWFHMISRCHNPNDAAFKYYGACGVQVDPNWFCYENFLRDLPYIPGFNEYLYSINYGGTKYQFDKDISQAGNAKNTKVYCKETCRFIPATYNLAAMVKDKKQNTRCSSDYYGVYRTEYGTFQSTVNINGEKHFLGTFKNEEDAALAYNREILKHAVNKQYYNLNELNICEVIGDMG